MSNNELFYIDLCSRLPYNPKVVSEEMGPSKLILFPISCIIKEIDFRGESFIPLQRLAYLNGGIEGEMELDCKYECLYRAFDGDSEFYYDSENSSFSIFSVDAGLYPPHNTLQMYDMMNNWMIDYRGLINKGLAISVYDLESNPFL